MAVRACLAACAAAAAAGRACAEDTFVEAADGRRLGSLLPVARAKIDRAAAATPRGRGRDADISLMNRGEAAAATWFVRGERVAARRKGRR